MNDVVYSHDELRAMIRPLLARYDMASASLFGSYAREEAGPHSDIDILLVGEKQGFRAINVFALAEDLFQASGKKVDVYEISELEQGSFRDTVLKEAVKL